MLDESCCPWKAHVMLTGRSPFDMWHVSVPSSPAITGPSNENGTITGITKIITVVCLKLYIEIVQFYISYPQQDKVIQVIDWGRGSPVGLRSRMQIK